VDALLYGARGASQREKAYEFRLAFRFWDGIFRAARSLAGLSAFVVISPPDRLLAGRDNFQRPIAGM